MDVFFKEGKSEQTLTLTHQAAGKDEAKRRIKCIVDYAYALTTSDDYVYAVLSVKETTKPPGSTLAYDKAMQA